MIFLLKPLSSTILVLALLNTLAPSLPAWAGAGKTQSAPTTPGKRPGTAAKSLSTAATRPIKDKWAVIIGIDKFKDQSIPQLQYPAKDAADFADFLISKGNFARDHVLLLTNENATRDKIRDAIGGNWLPRRVDQDDLVLIYASTHGSPKELDVAGENFLVAYDSDPQNLYVTGIRFSDLAPEIKERTGCDRVVLLLDACNSGSASVGGGGGGKGLVRTANFDVAALAGEGQIVISSSASNQRSYESKRYQNGVFTKQLINALERNPQKTTLSEAFNYLKEQVENEVRFDRKLEQTPVMRSKWSGGELILLAVPARPRHIDSDEQASMSATGTSRGTASGPADSIYQRAQELFDQKRYSECGPLALQAAEAGNAGGQYLCGMLCDKGLGQPRDAAKAAQWWKKSAEQGFAEGECWYGNIFRRGEVVPANPGKAVEWYQKAADQGNAHGQYLMGRMYMEGTGLPQNYLKAAEWYQKAADQGYIDGQINVGYLYEKGNGVPQNYGKAAEWYQKAADQGSANAQGKLGNLYEDGNGVPQNLDKAIQWYQKAAENGDRWAQGQLGALYEAGKGLPKNYEKAALWYQKAADQGSDWAQCQLGKLYAAGNGVPQNYEKAVEWYRKAAAQGSRTGYFYLAVMYFGGNGVPQNNEEAARLYEKAAEMGEPMAQNNLGHMYEKGLGLGQDYGKAIMWFQKSADQGNTLAMNNLALFYINGWGVPRDINKARALLSAAAARGDGKASQALQRLNQN